MYLISEGTHTSEIRNFQRILILNGTKISEGIYRSGEYTFQDYSDSNTRPKNQKVSHLPRDTILSNSCTK